MSRVRALVFFACTASVALAQSGSFKEQLISHYRNLKTFEADVVMLKEAEFLLQPLTSQVRIIVAGNKLIWKVLSPSPADLQFTTAGRLEGDALQKLPPEAEKRVAALVKFLAALLRADTAAMEKDFSLTFTADGLLAEAKKHSPLAFISSVAVTFAPNFDPKTLTLVLPQEKVLLTFKAVRQTTQDPP